MHFVPVASTPATWASTSSGDGPPVALVLTTVDTDDESDPEDEIPLSKWALNVKGKHALCDEGVLDVKKPKPITINPGGVGNNHKGLNELPTDKQLVPKADDKIAAKSVPVYKKSRVIDTANSTEKDSVAVRKALKRIVCLQDKMADAQANYKRAIKRLKTGPSAATGAPSAALTSCE